MSACANFLCKSCYDQTEEIYQMSECDKRQKTEIYTVAEFCQLIEEKST